MFRLKCFNEEAGQAKYNNIREIREEIAVIKKCCPICGKKFFQLITHRKEISPYQNKLFDDKQSALSCEKRTMEMVICENCGFVFNREFDTELDLYDKNYNNSQNASEIFSEYVDEKVRYLIENFVGSNTRKIVEIGCGREAKFLYDCYQYINNTDIQFVGYDPSFVACEGLTDINFMVFKKYYDITTSENLEADIIISRHVIEHVDEPLFLLKALSGLNSNNEKAIAYVETPDVTWILKNNVIFDFPYEHCSLFSPESLAYAMKESGLVLFDLKLTFNNQYICSYFTNSCGGGKAIDIKYNTEELIELAEKYRKNEDEVLFYLGELLKKCKTKGKIALWGAGAKANVMLNLLDKDALLVDYVIDINQHKQGKYISGTGHEISSKDVLDDNELRTIIVMNRNYYDEIKEIIVQKRNDLEIINIDMNLNV